MNIVLTPLSRTTVRLCEELDEVRYEPSIEAIAVGVVEGKIVLLAGRGYAAVPVYRRWDPRGADADYLREQFLLHEAWHVLLGHDRRKGTRLAREWNIACDAVIHHRSQIDLSAIEATGLRPVTFERLGMDPCRPERAYDQLVQSAASRAGTECADGDGCHTLEGCGRPDESAIRRLAGDSDTGEGSESDQRLDAALRSSFVDKVLDGAREDQVASGHEEPSLGQPLGPGWTPNPFCRGAPVGEASRSAPTIGKDIATWVKAVLEALRPVRTRQERGRSYRREHRGGHPLVPGRRRTGGIQPVFFLDASGSICDAHVQEMLTALRLTAQFSEAVTYVFDTTTRGPFRGDDIDAVRGAIAASGGGTRLVGAWEDVADHIDPAATRVWVTDGFDETGQLPDPWPDDLWVIGGGVWGAFELLSREEVDRRLDGYR